MTLKNPLTDRMITIINEGCIICAHNQNRDIIYPKDILFSILNDKTEIGCKILEVAGVDIDDIKSKINSFDCNTRNQRRTNVSNMHPLSTSILQKADNIATELGHNFIGTEHVILAFLSYKGKEPHLKKIVSIFEEYSICPDIYKDSIINYYVSSTSDISYGEDKGKMSNQKDVSDNTGDDDKDSQKNGLGNNLFLKNINKKVIAENMTFVGRTLEFERASRILSRKKKNNIILIGKEGVGKTSFVEGLAKKIVDGQVNNKLRNTTILSLDLAGMIAGTKYRGQFEERIKNVIDFLSKKRPNEKYILFIDEIHHILGTGAAEGALDAGSIIKTELSSGNIQCIGATTLKEYKKYILKDGPLARRLSPIFIEEPSIEETIKILGGIKNEYEEYHDVLVGEEAIVEIVNLSNRYIVDRNFPDKAIDILDEACTRKSIECSKPLEIEIIEGKIQKIRKKTDQFKNNRDFDKCKTLIVERDSLVLRLNELKEKYEDNLGDSLNDDYKIWLDKNTIRKVISEFSGIPIIDDEGETKKLAKMEEELNNIVINQKEAINKICKAIYRSKTGLKDPDRPIGVYVFLGETGTGKTYVAKELAKYHFGNKDKFIRIDMSEYMEKHSISKMIGSPPGYVGYDDGGGRLVDKVRSNPYSVILLDEFEKAHPDVFNLFLQAFDDGRMTDSYGDTVDLRNTIIILTSNVGVSKLSKKSMGFDANSTMNQIEKKKTLVDELKKIVTPEFFNRIDEVVVFNSLDLESVTRIFNIELERIKLRIASNGIVIECTENAVKFILEKGFSEKYGARPMRRALQKYVSDSLASKIVSGECQNDSVATFDYIDGDELVISVEKRA